MDQERLYQLLNSTERDLDEIAKTAMADPVLINLLIGGLNNSNPRIKFGCFNTLVKLSLINPQLLYERFDYFVQLLASENKIFKLGSIIVLAGLTEVDTENNFESIFDDYFALLFDPSMTPGANICKSIPKIVASKPNLADKIAFLLLKTSNTEYKTTECNNIIAGQAIDAFYRIYPSVSDQSSVLNFVKDNADNPRKGTRLRAAKFLKKYGG